MTNIGVLLSGCGVYDGSEIHEAVLTLLALDRAGVAVQCLAPNMDQREVVNHQTGAVTGESRNVLVESARIARGNIRDIKNIGAGDLDGLIMPGGFGAAKNLSDFALQGANATVHPEVERLLREMLAAGKPIGAICIAPATLTKALADQQPEVTIGSDMGTAAAIEAMGGKHQICSVDMIHVDRLHKIVTTPAYMLGPGIKEVAVGIEKLVNEVVRLAGA
ncbi:MAG: isoprenoid biosynthesis glyoxalase ElbB [Deltaproteobacteria bacterium]|nr:isoprenoid biosynthesis glyoxalase ElbB [Candidatus Anaeroferrophillus wilburensis]MBN2888111.1 isoprenoid biosynthesis glyoxalase ElbB [Deltaproteobacteria bacterium]